MKQQLHTTTCHSKPSLRACREVIFKLPHLLIFFFLCTYTSFAQQYEWDWATNGGSSNTGIGETGYSIGSEQIYDVKVGSDNNYYFLGTIKGALGTMFDGKVVETYNRSAYGNNDIFIFSTTCEGQVRWSRAIGGTNSDYAYNLALDSKNNIYIGAWVDNSQPNLGNDGRPVHFSETDSIAYPIPNSSTPQEGYKTIYLAKYDSNGQFKGKKALQGNNATNIIEGSMLIIGPVVDSNDHLHFVVGLRKGTGHLDGNVTVPTSIVAYQFYLAKYDSNLDYVNSIELPIPDGTGFGGKGGDLTHLAYDENLNRYYIAGMRSNNITASIVPLTYDGNAFVERSYILAIDGTDGSEIWRREIHTQLLNAKPGPNEITSLIVDTNSDVYIGGNIWKEYNEKDLKIYDPNNPTTTTYTFTPTPDSGLPLVAKFNSNGVVQWVKTPTDFASNYTTNTNIHPKGLALRQNEIAFGSSEGYFEWDGFTQNYPQFNGVSPTVLRFDKQTGNTLGMHWIEGTSGNNSYMTAIAVDNDGNYVTGGSFLGSLFTNGGKVSMINGGSKYNFFVAKLAASVCGTTVSTEEFNTIAINVYPNPTTDKVYFETEEKLKWYNVYNDDAQQVKVQTQINEEDNYQMSFEGLPTGVYFVLIKTESGKSATVKVIKE